MRMSFDQMLKAVEVAARSFGKDAAAALWREFRLPAIPGVTDGPGLVPRAEHFRGFLAAATEPSAGSSIPARQFYRAYCQWSVAAGQQPVTETAFGLYLPRLGIEKRYGRIRSYIGISLKETFKYYESNVLALKPPPALRGTRGTARVKK